MASGKSANASKARGSKQNKLPFAGIRKPTAVSSVEKTKPSKLAYGSKVKVTNPAPPAPKKIDENLPSDPEKVEASISSREDSLQREGEDEDVDGEVYDSKVQSRKTKAGDALEHVEQKAAYNDEKSSTRKMQAQAPAAITDETEQVAKEMQADQVSDEKIARYWKNIEDERIYARQHQAKMTDHDKILRLFDMSSQYGPCVGISRIRRWKRAHGLGLHPPIEVLAVLAKEKEAKNTEAENAYMELILGNRVLEKDEKAKLEEREKRVLEKRTADQKARKTAFIGVL